MFRLIVKTRCRMFGNDDANELVLPLRQDERRALYEAHVTRDPDYAGRVIRGNRIKDQLRRGRRVN